MRRDQKTESGLRRWLRCLVQRWRDRRAVRKWNADLPRIRTMAGDDSEQCFKWRQLVWQEIGMWIRIGEKVDQEEFDWLCDRRGFNAEQRQYLSDMMEHVRLKDFSLNTAIRQEGQPND